jgi:hypothetical protein
MTLKYAAALNLILALSFFKGSSAATSQPSPHHYGESPFTLSVRKKIALYTRTKLQYIKNKT